MHTLNQQDRTAVALMALTAATLAVASALHLFTGEHGDVGAGVAEAVIFVALLGGVRALLRGSMRGRSAALGATTFAALGFVVGLTFTLRGGDAANLIYHLTMLPVLIGTLILLIRSLGGSAARGVS